MRLRPVRQTQMLRVLCAFLRITKARRRKEAGSSKSFGQKKIKQNKNFRQLNLGVAGEEKMELSSAGGFSQHLD